MPQRSSEMRRAAYGGYSPTVMQGFRQLQVDRLPSPKSKRGKLSTSPLSASRIRTRRARHGGLCYCLHFGPSLVVLDGHAGHSGSSANKTRCLTRQDIAGLGFVARLLGQGESVVVLRSVCWQNDKARMSDLFDIMRLASKFGPQWYHCPACLSPKGSHRKDLHSCRLPCPR
jgi:hypothetical protein